MLIIANNPSSTPDRSADLLLIDAASTLDLEYASPLAKGHRSGFTPTVYH
jgi:hypothetical protein